MCFADGRSSGEDVHCCVIGGAQSLQRLEQLGSTFETMAQVDCRCCCDYPVHFFRNLSADSARMCRGDWLGLLSGQEVEKSCSGGVNIALRCAPSSELLGRNIAVFSDDGPCEASLKLVSDVKVDELQLSILPDYEIVRSDIAMHYWR